MAKMCLSPKGRKMESMRTPQRRRQTSSGRGGGRDEEEEGEAQWVEPGRGAGEQEGGSVDGDEVPMVDRVYALIERVQGASGAAGESPGDITLSDIKALFSFPMDRFQIQTVEAFLRGSSVVVAAPTSSGKTPGGRGSGGGNHRKGRQDCVHHTPQGFVQSEARGSFGRSLGRGTWGL